MAKGKASVHAPILVQWPKPCYTAGTWGRASVQQRLKTQGLPLPVVISIYLIGPLDRPQAAAIEAQPSLRNPES